MINKIFKTDESKFSIEIGLKFSSITLFTLFLTGIVLWFFAKINLLFFISNGYGEAADLVSAYYDFIAEDVFIIIPYVFIVVIATFFIGLYISFFLLRPFNDIGKYCLRKVEGRSYGVNFRQVVSYKLLSSFGHYFFNWLDERIQDNKFIPNTIPNEYQKIHCPIFEKPFFVFYSLIVFGLILLSSVSIYFVGVSIHEKIVNLAISILNSQSSLKVFLQGQEPLIMGIMLFIIFLMSFLYLLLAINLYGRISGASFAFFSTMRSFMKGDLNARVHLIEYKYVRENGRFLNKLLSYSVSKFDKN